MLLILLFAQSCSKNLLRKHLLNCMLLHTTKNDTRGELEVTRVNANPDFSGYQ